MTKKNKNVQCAGQQRVVTRERKFQIGWKAWGSQHNKKGFVAGHGGEDFLKFQDAEEISNVELADAFEQMWQKRRLVLQSIVFNCLFLIHDSSNSVVPLNRI